MARAKPKALLRAELTELRRAPTGAAEQRGFALERLIARLLAHEQLRPAFGFRPAGEQIDGFFELDARFFHLECKWEAMPTPVSSIYAFRGKIEGKLIGTLGVFLSMSGYAPRVPDALRYGKQIDVVLFDSDDLVLALDDRYSFTEVLRTKLRHAARNGGPYYAYKTYLDETKA